MVNNSGLRLIQPADCTLAKKQDRTIITNGPVYCLATAQAHLSTETIFVLNDKANADMVSQFSPQLTDEDLVAFILALTPDDRENSERCMTSIKKVIDCDAYAMKWNRFSRKRWADAPTIYLKFGFSEHNPKLLVISIHPSTVKK